jgi:hypothetical protein
MRILGYQKIYSYYGGGIYLKHDTSWYILAIVNASSSIRALIFLYVGHFGTN